MTERVNNIYQLVTNPVFYSLFQNLLGTDSARKRLVAKHYDMRAGMRVLDVGCGPGDLLAYLPDVDYTGIDRNERHIEQASRRYASKGVFVCDDVANLRVNDDVRFERIIFSGLLHHLEDETAELLIENCANLLTNDGRIVGHEPCYVEGQHPIARWMKNRDSGKNIRRLEGYRQLFSKIGGTLKTELTDDLIRIPYDHVLISWSR